jgi:hypothetical protein
VPPGGQGRPLCPLMGDPAPDIVRSLGPRVYLG